MWAMGEKRWNEGKFLNVLSPGLENFKMNIEYQEIGDLSQKELEVIKKRFWEKVLKTNSHECWLWQASKRYKGYGAFAFTPIKTGRLVQGRAHRFSYEIHMGPIGNMFVLHKCDNPACVNPNHLFLGTNQDNVTDMMNKGRHIPGGTYNRSGYEKGETHHAAKLTIEIVKQIRDDYASGEASFSALSKKYKIAIGHISRIINRKAWKHVA